MNKADFYGVVTLTSKESFHHWKEVTYLRSVVYDGKGGAWTVQVVLWAAPDDEGKAFVWGYWLTDQAREIFKDVNEFDIYYGARIGAHVGVERPMPEIGMVDTDALTEGGPVRKMVPQKPMWRWSDK